MSTRAEFFQSMYPGLSDGEVIDELIKASMRMPIPLKRKRRRRQSRSANRPKRMRKRLRKKRRHPVLNRLVATKLRSMLPHS